MQAYEKCKRSGKYAPSGQRTISTAKETLPILCFIKQYSKKKTRFRKLTVFPRTVVDVYKLICMYVCMYVCIRKFITREFLQPKQSRVRARRPYYNYVSLACNRMMSV